MDKIYDRIFGALDALGILQYKDDFVGNELDDLFMEECISDGSIDSVLKDIIPVMAHRMKLKKSILCLYDPNALVQERDLVPQSIPDNFQQYHQPMEAQISDAEKLLNDEINLLIENYKVDMNSKINSQIISDEELEGIHSSVFEKCLENFANSHSSSLSYERGRESLVKQISSVHDNLQKMVRAAYENAKKEGAALMDVALASYREKMENDIGIDEEVFEKSHRLHKASSMQILRSADNISRTKIIDKLANLLESNIHHVHIELQLLLLQNKTKVEKEIVKAKEAARKGFEEAIQTLFDQKVGPIPELKLIARCNHEKSQALNSLKEFYEGKKAVSKNGEEQQMADSNELAEAIQNIFIKFQDTNTIRWQTFELQAQNFLSQTKTEYTRKLKIVCDDTFDEEELGRKNAALSDEAKKLLLENVDPHVANSEFIKKLLDDFKSYVETHFGEMLEVFELRMQEDEVAVQAALLEAKKYYNEEMDKRVKRKDWFESDELSALNDELTAAAVKICKEDVILTDNQEKQLRNAMKIVYLKYLEENQRRYPVENLAIGIDLGTTYSCVAVYMNGKVKIIPNREVGERATTPSYVAFNKDRTIDVGEAAKRQAHRNPLNTIFDAKRLIGRAYSDNVVQQDIKLWPFEVISDDGKPQIRVRGKNYRPEEISAKVLAKMKQIAETYLQNNVKQAVVTVPAYFSDGQRQATRDAAEIAGLKVTILNEPTAAAIAYKLHRTDELKRNVLIYDLGGGTFDVAVLEMKGGKIKVKATGGDTHLGGEDFDNKMVNSIIEKAKSKYGIDLARGRNSADPNEKARASERLRRIRDRCEAAKRDLSSTTSTIVAIDRIDEDLDLSETFTRIEFEQLNMAQFKRSIDIVKRALEDAKLSKADVDDIVLVGGSTRIPKVQELLKAFFDGRKELNCTINADEAVAYGAAIQAALLNGEQAAILGRGVKLTDVAPLSLGIENSRGDLIKVIHKNSPVPCSHTEVFRTAVNNQTNADFKVYEGENPIAVDNNFLGKFILTGIPRAPAGREPLDVTMTIDGEGILHAKAVIRKNGKASDITIKTYNGRMTEEEIGIARSARHFHW